MTQDIPALIAEAREEAPFTAWAQDADLLTRLADALEAEHQHRQEWDKADRLAHDNLLAERDRYRDAIEDALGHAHECYRSDLTCVETRILTRALDEAPNRPIRHEEELGGFQGEPTDAQADAAQKAFHEFTFGPDDGFLTPRRMGVTRQAWKVALRAAFNETGESR
ncbi:hypothetical protein ACTJJ4_11690 [Microbacterium sp. 22195]|uniref:hypothetical protein n=1 Tax=Microbacterium sp. 22195 TaxID=3453891 RepID=UPI003F824E7A